MNPKISIIVPVYKVEPYLRKCIDSILNQTFKDFELILVDDGSPDRCGEICGEYAKRDSRIVVIHKENGGLASARNVGLDIAKGDYIGFVDSDDWIEHDMYELLYKICINYNCDIANCSSKIFFKNKTVINGGHQLIIHSRAEAMEVMLRGELYDEVVWTKLIKRELLKDIRFKSGIIYEDTDFTYKVMDKAERVGCIGEAKYNYIKRENSIMDRAVKNVRIDAVLIYDEMYRFMDQKYPFLKRLVVHKLANNAMSIMNLIIGSNQFKSNKDKYFTVAKILNKYYTEVIKIGDYPYTVKVLLSLNKIHPNLYKFLIEKVVI